MAYIIHENGQLWDISVESSTARKLIGGSDADKLKRLTQTAIGGKH